ncbi:hypothetical protein O181_013470 [Austropuccinia psidii MF-1]|uniref:Uncharacterized protein n=1 Tax=Austropuccinia psidii MF-1 TaxID=1389203 RepID=A0A9Q3GNY6_9BASI|nr:hypothetical protein [Austropuccinia psidii MF-1]
MVFLTTLALPSLLGFTSYVQPAPLNSPSTLLSRGVGEGWLCHYDGMPMPNVDLSINLPTMLQGLCAKVNYDYAGCESFRLNPSKVDQPVVAVSAQLPHTEDNSACTPSKDGTSPSICVNINAGRPDSPNKVTGPSPDSSVPVSAESADTPQELHEEPEVKDNLPKNEKPSVKKPTVENPTTKKPLSQEQKKKHHVSNHHEPTGDLGPQSFASPLTDKNPESKKHHSNKSVPKLGNQPHKPAKNPKNPTDLNPDSNVGSLSNDGPENVDICDENQYYSSQLDKCVDKKFFNPPMPDSSCEHGELDLVIKLCLDVSLLANTHNPEIPTAAVEAVNPSSPESFLGQKKTCSPGQKYTSILATCVDTKLLSAPLIDGKCQDGWKLDVVLGICLDIASCKQ